MTTNGLPAFEPVTVPEGGSSAHQISVRLVAEDGHPVVNVDGVLHLTPGNAERLAGALVSASKASQGVNP